MAIDPMAGARLCVDDNARIAALEEELDAARADAERWQDRAERCAVAMALFASVIKSGEPWTDECQRVLDAARKERNVSSAEHKMLTAALFSSAARKERT